MTCLCIEKYTELSSVRKQGLPKIADRKLCFGLFCHSDPEPKP